MNVLGMKLDGGYRDSIPSRVICCMALLAGMVGWTLAADSLAGDSLAGLADPTQPASFVAPAGIASYRPSGPLLQSTFISASKRRAVISGKTYTVGDKFSGAVITEILPYEVVMKQAGKESHLRLLPKLAKETILMKVPTDSQEGGKK